LEGNKVKVRESVNQGAIEALEFMQAKISGSVVHVPIEAKVY